MKDGLFGTHPFRIRPEWLARVGIPVNEWKIAACDGDSYAVAFLENMTCEHQADMQIVYMPRFH